MTEEEFEAQLQWAMNYAENYGGRATVSLGFLQAVQERSAKLAAVPVEAIIAYRANSDESEGLIRSGKHDDFVDFDKATEALDEWIITQVQP